MNNLLQYLLDRLQEDTTWVAIIAGASAFGIHFHVPAHTLAGDITTIIPYVSTALAAAKTGNWFPLTLKAIAGIGTIKKVTNDFTPTIDNAVSTANTISNT